jgi:hypothetical protein
MNPHQKQHETIVPSQKVEERRTFSRVHGCWSLYHGSWEDVAPNMEKRILEWQSEDPSHLTRDPKEPL